MVLGPGTLGPGRKTLRRRGRGQSTQRRSWTQEQGPGSTPARGQRRRRSSALGPARGLVLGGTHTRVPSAPALTPRSPCPVRPARPRPTAPSLWPPDPLYPRAKGSAPPVDSGLHSGRDVAKAAFSWRPARVWHTAHARQAPADQAGWVSSHARRGPPGQAHGGAVQPPACPLSAPAHLSFR